MNLMPMADILQSAGLGVQGETIFINRMPPAAQRAILLRSPLAGTKIDYELPGFYQTEFQLIARSHDYADGEALVTQAMAMLLIEVETDIDGVRVNYCRPRTDPITYPLSLGNLLEFSVTFSICFVKA